MGGSRTTAAILVTLIYALLFTACGGGGGAILDDPIPDQTTADSSAGLVDAGRTSSGFTLGILRDTFLGGDPAGDFTVEESRNGDETVITVSVSGADDLRACYGSLSYDAARYTPVAVDQLPLVSEDCGGEVLTLSDTTTPGTVDFGQVLANCDQRNGLTGAAVVARLRFSAGAYTGGRTVSSVPDTDDEAPEFLIDFSGGIARWTYFMKGDYNQDGLVGLSDLTPFGYHYGEQAEYWPGFTPGTVQWVIDANHDKLISIHDITAIGQNYGRTVKGFNIYSSETIDNRLPYNNYSLSKLPALSGVSFDQALGDPGTEQLWFEVELDSLVDETYHWVRPTDGSSEGTPSNTALMDISLADSFNCSIRGETEFFGGSYDEIRFETGCDGEWFVDVWLNGAADLTYCAVQMDFDGARLSPNRVLVPDPVTPGWLPSRFIYGEERAVSPGSLAVFYKDNGDEELTYPVDQHVIRSYFNETSQDMSAFVLNEYSGSASALAEYDTETGELRWYYVCLADFNQDGFVNGPDIISLREYAPTAPPLEMDGLPYFMCGHTDWGELWAVSAMQDMTFTYNQARDGYAIYYTDDQDYFPADFDFDEAWRMETAAQLQGHIDLADAQGDRLRERLQFTYQLDDPQPGRYYWAVPEYQGELGTVPSGSVIQIPAE